MTTSVVSKDNENNDEGRRKWASIQAELRTVHGDDIYTSWFEKIEFVQFSGNVVELSTPTPFIRHWTQTRYGSEILTLWRAAHDNALELRFKVRGALRPAERPMAAGAEAPHQAGRTSREDTRSHTMQILRSLRIPGRLLRSDRGGVMIEFGFAMPVLILLMLGGVELGRYVLLHQKLDRTAMTVSDLVARVQTVTTAEVDTVFTAANLVMEPFTFSSQGAVVISSVKRDSGSPKVIWQRTGAGTLTITSVVGTQGGNATISDNDLVDDDQAIVIGETYYQYTPWFIDLIPSTTLRHTAVFRPRLSGEVTCGDC